MKITLKDGSEHHVDSAVAQALTIAGALQPAAAFLCSNSDRTAEIEEAIDNEKPIAWLLKSCATRLKVGDTVEIQQTEGNSYRAEVANITTKQPSSAVGIAATAINLVLVNLRRVAE
jgi:hypothetical protein